MAVSSCEGGYIEIMRIKIMEKSSEYVEEDLNEIMMRLMSWTKLIEVKFEIELIKSDTLIKRKNLPGLS